MLENEGPERPWRDWLRELPGALLRSLWRVSMDEPALPREPQPPDSDRRRD